MRKLFPYLIFSFLLSISTYAQSDGWKFDSVFPKDSSMKNGICGLAVDPEGKVWVQSYYPYAKDTLKVPGADENDNFILRTVSVSVLHVFNPDGTEAGFSPIFFNRRNGVITDTLGGATYVGAGKKNPAVSVPGWVPNTGSGLSTDSDGNIIAAYSDRIFKFDYRTGEGLIPCLLPGISGKLAKPVQDYYGNYYVRGVADILSAIRQLDKNGNFIKYAADSSLGFSRVIEVTGDGLTIFNAAFQDGVIESYKRTSLDGPVFKKNLIKGVACESMAWDWSAGNLWFSSGSYSYNLNNYPGEKTYWDYHTWYAYNPVTNKIADSLKWVFFGDTYMARLNENPRAIAFSPDGKTSYAGTFPNGAVRKYVKVNGTLPSITVTSPSAGENWTAGSQQTVTWTSSNFTGNVNIKLSVDGGTSFPFTIRSNVPDTGSLPVTVPANMSYTCRIRVESANDISVYGLNPGNFYITGLRTLKLQKPQGGEVWTAGKSCSISYTSNYISKINIDLSTDDGNSWSSLRKGMAALTGGVTVDLLAPLNILSTKCRIKLVCVEDTTLYDISDSVFTIQPVTYVDLLAPQGGENFKIGEKLDIIWAFKTISNIRLEFSSDNGNSWTEIAASVPALQLKYPWIIPNTPSSQCLIRITDISNETYTDSCNKTFKILSPPSISLSKKMLNFGCALLGKSAQDSVVIGNNGETELIVTGISSEDNSFSSDMNSFSVEPGKAHVLHIKFRPGSSVNLSGRLIISHNSETKSDTLFLSGSGLNYPQQIAINGTHIFGPVTNLSNYRMIGFPGNINIPAAELFKGNYPVDWNMFDDNGNATNYQVGYDGSSKFNLTPGKAFWVLSREPVNISMTVENVKIDTADISYSIPLHNGWNLISNPFNIPVSWQDVRLLNKLEDNNILYQWKDKWLYPEIFEPYSGYYFNNLKGSQTLKIPYSSTSGLSRKKGIAANCCSGDSIITVSLLQEGEAISEAAIKFNFSASAGFDANDFPAAPGDFDHLKVVIYEPAINLDYKYLMTESVPGVGEGRRFELRIKNISGAPATLKISRNLDLKDCRIYLLDRSLQKIHDLSGRKDYELRISKTESVYDLLIGSSKFIEQNRPENKITEFSLFQNYPNPFNPATFIKFSLAEESKARIVIYNSIGQAVKIYDDIYESAGYYEIEWNASDLSSGIYICCLEVVSGVTGRIYTDTKKMLLLK